MYLHYTPEEADNLTMVQFEAIIDTLSKKFTWEVQMAAIPGGNKLKPEYHPLYVEPKASSSGNLESFEKQLRQFVK